MTSSSKMASLDTKVSGFIIGLMRIVVGLLWLANLEWKRPRDFGLKAQNGLYKYVDSAIRNPVLGIHKYFIQHVVLPHYTFFGWVTLFTEAALAVALLLGWHTRIAALVGAAMTINIALSVLYYDKAAEWPWSYYLMFAAHLLLFAIAAGRHLGLDGVLSKDGAAARMAIRVLGGVAIVVALLGFLVARSTGFAAKQGALLGWSRGELKLLWFTPLSALLTLVLGIVSLIAAQLGRRELGLVAALGFAVMALLTALQWHVQSDGAWTGGVLGGTGANMAFWAMLAAGLARCSFRASGRRGAADGGIAAGARSMTSATAA